MNVEKEAGGRKKKHGTPGLLIKGTTPPPMFHNKAINFFVILLDLCIVLKHVKQSGYQPRCVIANPARGQLNRGYRFSLSPFAPKKLFSRDGFGRPVPRQYAHSPHPA